MNNKKFEDLKYTDLIKQYLKLNKSEFKVFMAIVRSKKKITMVDLIKRVGKDRTTIQRTLNNLLEKDIISFEQENLHKGFRYKYFIENSLKFRIINDIQKDIKKLLFEFDKEVNKWDMN